METQKNIIIPEIPSSKLEPDVLTWMKGIQEIIKNISKSTGSDFELTKSYLKSFPHSVNGLTLSNNSSDASHDIDIATGNCMDSTYTYKLTLENILTKQIDATWIAGTNAGGLDTGTVAASKTYHIWLIQNNSDKTIDAVISLSATAPTMPSGYTYKRVIGCVITDGSANIYPFYQVGNIFRYKTMIYTRELGTLGASTRIVLSVSLPENLFGIFNVLCGWPDASAHHFLIAQAIAETDTGPTEVINSHIAYTQWEFHGKEMNILVDNNRQIAIRGDNALVMCGIKSLGWIDHRI